MAKPTPIEKARDIVGGTTALAKLLKLEPPTVSEWISGKRPVPAEHCPEIERATGGAVRCEELCPKVDWGYLRNEARTS